MNTAIDYTAATTAWPVWAPWVGIVAAVIGYRVLAAVMRFVERQREAIRDASELIEDTRREFGDEARETRWAA